MKHVLRPPCRECPFLKKSAPGWLGPDKPETVWARVHGEADFGYPCHMDVEKVKAAGGDLTDEGSVEQCVGALLHAKKTCKRFSDPWREAAKEAIAAVIGLAGILGFEFREHHTIAAPTGRRRR